MLLQFLVGIGLIFCGFQLGRLWVIWSMAQMSVKRLDEMFTRLKHIQRSVENGEEE